MKTRAYMALSILLVISGAGCALLYKPIPDLHAAPWSSLTVYYFPEGKRDWRQKWVCTNAVTLASLQAAYSVTDGGDLWGYGGYTPYNRLVLTMANGREYDMYILEPDNFTLNDYKHLQRGFGVDLRPEFYERLKDTLESETGTPVNFFAPKE
ncbi:MAG: hypothetical protein KBA51_04700 [Kiritimatiellae bacterium]|nr:hypothetical protein [Kiritimatiellia bacterium]